MATFVCRPSTPIKTAFLISWIATATTTVLSDKYENENGIDSTKADTDGDGVTDLIEVAADTDVFSKDDSPRTRGDFVFTIPYQEEAFPREDTLNFRTNIQYADMYILIDRSGSMSGEMASIKKALSAAVDTLTCDDYGVSLLWYRKLRARTNLRYRRHLHSKPTLVWLH